MAGSTFGNIFKITTWGESHGKALGVVVDGCPSGLELNEDDIQVFLNRRRPGFSDISTPRKEEDQVEILSGIFDGKTTGTPISMLVHNKDQHSSDYGNIVECYRPGHADYGFDKKYGFRDYRGGGRSSGRETIGRVAAGAIACKILTELGITFKTYVNEIAGIRLENNIITTDIKEVIDKKISEGDSIGSQVECIISGVPAGIGETVFEKLDASLSKAVMSIGAVKAVEIGDGIMVSKAFGHNNNDSFINKDGKISKSTNHSGGILGGMSDGSDIIIRAHFKPTPSISMLQQTVDLNGNETDLVIKGRHDPLIAPRAAVVVECMSAITVLDLMFMGMSSRLDKIKDFWK